MPRRSTKSTTSSYGPMSGMRDMMGPLGVDQAIRGAISTCWHLLPPDERTIERLEEEVMRIVRRVLEDIREDAGAFGYIGDVAENEDDVLA